MKIISVATKTLLWALLLIFGCGTVLAQERPKVGLVLSGGGAKGVAHIGALKVIEEANIPIDYICGTSMGAVIGALYAIGYNAHSLDSMVRRQDWPALLFDERTPESLDNERKYILSIPISASKKLSMPSSIAKGQNILNKFVSLTAGFHGYVNFDSLPIPFACVAGDLVEGKEIVIHEGDLPLAMRTSMAVPGFFEPVCRDNMVLVDGGIFNNFPVDVMRKTGADIVIGVDLSTKDIKEADYSSAIEIINRLAMLSGSSKYQHNKQQTDVYINPSLVGYKMMDFAPAAITAMIEKGEIAARKQWDRLLEIKKQTGNVRLHPEPAALPGSADSIQIRNIQINGLSTYTERWFKDIAGIDENTYTTLQQIEESINNLEHTRIFTSLSYRIMDEGKLVYYVTEAHHSTFNVNLNINNEDIASVLLDTRLKLGTGRNHNFSLSSRVNRSPWIDLNYFYRFAGKNFTGGTYRIHYNNFKLKNYGNTIDDFQFLSNHVELYWGRTNFKSCQFKTGLQCDIFTNASDLYRFYGQPYTSKADSYSSCFIDWSYNTFDNDIHPGKGMSCHLRSACYMDNSSFRWKDLFGIVSINARMAIPLGYKLTLLPEFTGRLLVQDGNGASPFYYRNFIGGEWANQHVFSQLSVHGIHFTEITDNLIMDSTLELQYNVAQKQYLQLSGSYIYQADGFEHFRRGKSSYDIALSYLYSSFIGPIRISFDYSGYTKRLGCYISIGYSL